MITEDEAYYEGIETFYAKTPPVNPYRRKWTSKSRPATVEHYNKLALRWDEGFVFASHLKKEMKHGV